MIETALGWVGTAGTLGAYLMLSRGRLESTSTTYALLNVVGGILAGMASAAYGAWPSATANMLWALISVRTLAVALRGQVLSPVVAAQIIVVKERLRRSQIALGLPVRSSVGSL
jgi:hypothetical protein